MTKINPSRILGAKSPPWLAGKRLLKHFWSQDAYGRFVAEGMHSASSWGELQGQSSVVSSK